MSANTPHRIAYLALLCLPHDAVRHSLAVQSAMATLRDHLASTDRQDGELLQSTFENIAFVMNAEVSPAPSHTGEG